MQPYELSRTGNAPVRFTGELLAAVDGFRSAGKENNRWHELAVYRTAGGQIVGVIQYRTRWQGEEGRDLVEVLASPAAATSFFRDHFVEHDPTGYPPGDHYAEKQARLIADVRRRYESAVTELLSQSADVFAETIA